MAIDQNILQQAISALAMRQLGPGAATQTVAADLTAAAAPTAARGLPVAAGALAPAAVLEQAPSSALETLRRGALARQVLEGQVLAEPAEAAGISRLAAYTRPAAAAAPQLALPAGQQLAAQAAAAAGPGGLGGAGRVAGAAANAFNVGSMLRGVPTFGAGAAGAGAAAGSEAAVAAGTTARLRAALGAGGRGGLVRGAGTKIGLPALAGYVGGQAFNKIAGEHPDSGWDEAGTGALTGAGLGAGIGGTVGSVFPVVGTAIGAGVGAGVGAIGGGLIGMFGPKDSGQTPTNQELTRQLAAVDKMAAKAGLDDDVRTQLALQLQAGREGVTSKTKMKELGAQVQAMIPQLAGEQVAQRRQQAQALAIQAAAQPLLQRYLDRAATSAREQQMMLNEAAGGLPEGLAELYRARGASYVADSDQMNAALAAQIANLPNQQARDLQDAIRGQVQSQAVAQVAAQLTGAAGQQSVLDQLLSG